MKIKRLTKDEREKWLKWLFSFKTITVIAGLIIGVVAAYYSYKSYMDNKPPQLGMEIRGVENSMKINVDYIYFFRNYYVPYYNIVLLNTANAYSPSGIPYIFNNSSKIMNRFKLEIHVEYSRFDIDITKVSGEFKILNLDTIRGGLFKTMDLNYKSDVLYAQSAIPIPFYRMSIPKSDSISNENNAWVRLCYKIVYDGIPKPKKFEVFYYSYFGEFEDFDNYENPEDFEEEYIEMFLSDYYSDDDKYSLITLVSVLDMDVSKIVIPPKKFTEAKFEKFKKDFIEDFKKQKSKKKWYEEE